MYKISNLSKTYYHRNFIWLLGDKGYSTKALDSVSLEFSKGQIVGLVGENGSGKTTLLKILANLIEPDSGTIDLSAAANDISYISGSERSFFWRLSVRENLLFFARMNGFSTKEIEDKITIVLEKLNISHYADYKFMTLSSGTKKKVSIARALIKNPKLFLFDEITNSMDTKSSLNFLATILDIVKEEKEVSVIWATHKSDEITKLADKAIHLENGKNQDSDKKFNL